MRESSLFVDTRADYGDRQGDGFASAANLLCCTMSYVVDFVGAVDDFSSGLLKSKALQAFGLALNLDAFSLFRCLLFLVCHEVRRLVRRIGDSRELDHGRSANSASSE